MKLDLKSMRIAAIMVAASLTFAANAQSGRTLTIIVPQPAGNPTDGIARKMQPLLQKELGQTVIVENAPGAGGSIGTQKVLRATGDGQTLLISSQTEPILTPLSMPGARYKPEDLRAVGLVARAPYILAGRPDLAATTLAELVEQSKKPGAKPLSFGHIGAGSMIHLLGEEWSRRSGVPVVHVPYKGVPPLVQDLMGSQIDVTFLPLGGSTQTLIETGKVRAYGNTAATPSPGLPKLPTMAAQDKALAGFVYGTWAAFFVPRSTPDDAVTRLHQALIAAMKDAEVQSYVQSTGLEMAGPLSLSELERFYQTETRLYQTMARSIGVDTK